MQELRIPLRVVFYKEDGDWIAHCLEFDLCGDGPTKKEAVQSLVQSIALQLEHTTRHKNPRNLFSPAPSEIQEKFFAGKNSAEGELSIQLKQDHVIIEEAVYREYSDDFSDAECVPA